MIIPWHQSLSPLGACLLNLHVRKQGCGATAGVPAHVGRALHSQWRTARGALLSAGRLPLREKALCKQVMWLSEIESHPISNAQPAFGAALRDPVLPGGDTPSSWSLYPGHKSRHGRRYLCPLAWSKSSPSQGNRLPTMEASATTVLLLALCLSCLLLLLRGGRGGTKARLPPGPQPLPFIGNLPHLDAKNMIKSLMELSRQYGSLFTIHMGSRPVVVLCGYQTVKEALVDQGEEFSGRGDMPVLFRFTQGNGIAFSNGEKWKSLRRFAIQTLRDFGMGKRSIEERIQEEAQCLVKEFAKRTEPFDPTFLLGCSVSNVICSIVFGDRFDYEDQHFLTFIGLINDNFRLFSSPCAQMYNIFPHIMYYLPGPHNQIFANFEKLRALVKEMAKAHQASLDPNCPRDFIDCFLLKMQQEKEDPHSFFHTDTLIMTTHNLFFAGTETISTTLRYALLILMKFPEVAAKVQEEIAKVIGSERQPSIADRARMPYTDAVIHEVQRFANIIPMGIPHALTKDTHFRGFFFPEGTNVLPFFHSVHRDATQFENPEMFDPGHFLDEEGAFRRSNAFMPFSAGKRLCLGEALARMELFLYLTALLQRFSFQPSCPRDQLDLSPMMSGIGNVPRPYSCRPLPR